MTRARTDLAPRLVATLLVTANLIGQHDGDHVVLHAAVAAAPLRTSVPALQWLLETGLPGRPEWPANLSPSAPFTITIDGDKLTVSGCDMALPENVVAVGSCALADGPAALFQCSRDGVEDWFVPRNFVAPERWRSLLTALDADVLDTPRRLDASVVLGHLAGPVAEGDVRHDLLQLAASLCGTVTWTAWRTEQHLRVRGRGDGGLVLPALLMVLADCQYTSPSLSLRAFAARDDDRAEAARQLARRDDPADIRTLTSLLFADDAVCLAAIDSLVRRGAADHLPDIVRAATADHPLATRAAIDAVASLWPMASAEAKQQVRVALARSNNLELRRLDVGDAWRQLPQAARPVDDGSWRARCLLLQFVVGCSLYGLWLRERARRPSLLAH